MLELYHNDMSVCAQKVRVVIRQKSLECVMHALDIRSGATHTPAYRALNPKGVVPTLVVDGTPIVESTVICEYLDDAFPDCALRPSDPIDRSTMRQWTLRPDAGLHRACSVLSFAVAFRHQDTSRQMASRKEGPVTSQLREVIEQGLQSTILPQHLDVWSELLDDLGDTLKERDWLAGESFSLADIAILPYICRLRDLSQSWLWEEQARRYSIRAWLDRCVSQVGYSGLSDFYDPKYLDLMNRCGRDASNDLRTMFK